MSQELRDKLKAARAKLALTQNQFAQRLGIPARTLESWEADRATPRGFALVALNQTLDAILADK